MIEAPPAGSNSSSRVPSAATGQCLTPRVTTHMSPGSSTTWGRLIRVALEDGEPSFGHHEELVGVEVVVPGELSGDVYDLDVLVVHRGDDPGAPQLIEGRVRLLQVDRPIHHVTSSVGTQRHAPRLSATRRIQ